MIKLKDILNEASAYKTATRNELAMYITQLSNTINGTKDRKMLQYLKSTKKEVSAELKNRKKTDEGKLNEKKPWGGYQKHANHGKATVDFLNLLSSDVDWKKYNKLTDKGKNVIFFTKKYPKPLVWQTSNGREVQATDLKGGESSYKSYKVDDIYKVLVEGKLNEGDKSLAYFIHIGYDIFDSIQKLDKAMKQHSVASKSSKIKKIVKGLYKLESDLSEAINDLEVSDSNRGYDKKRFKKR